MTRRIATAAALACAALTAPLTVAAQQAAPPPAAAPEAMKRELQEIRSQLEPLQQRALENQELRQEQEAVDAAVRAALIAADPANEGRLQRLEAIRSELVEAQAANDTEKTTALNAEQQKLYGEMETSKASVLAQEELSARLTAFKTRLNDATIAIDPNAKQLLTRKQELEEKLKAAGIPK